MFKARFDLDEFLEKGYFVREIDESVADRLLNFLKAEPFVNPNDVFGGEIYNAKNVYAAQGHVVEPNFNLRLKEALSWDWQNNSHPHIWAKGMNALEDAHAGTTYPEILNEFWQGVIEEQLSWFTRTHGPFSRIGMLAHRYQQGNSLGWHHDVSDSTWLNNILYLGDRDFEMEDGGYLMLGRCGVDSEGIPIIHKVLESDSPVILAERLILPTHGVMVTMNNRRPDLLHKVYPLLTEKTRYTLSCQVGYMENLVGKKFKRE